MQTMLTVPSWTLWNDTGLDVPPQGNLHFVATGQWTDWYINTTPAGYEKASLKAVEHLRRLPSANWFALVGAFDKDLSTAFLIGEGRTLVAEKGGRLFVFANDIAWLYWNNVGSVSLSITMATS